jgi:hypothetical protein
MPKFSKKNYKLFLCILDIREIFVELFTNSSDISEYAKKHLRTGAKRRHQKLLQIDIYVQANTDLDG